MTAPRPAPLLPTQQTQWEAYLGDPASTTFGIEVLLRVEGDLDVAALERAFDAVGQAQPALRATFHQGPGEQGAQVVHPGTGRLPLRVDVRDDPDPEAAVHRQVAALVAEPFVLGRGPLLRALLIRTGARDHVLVLSLPRVVVDGWSLGLLVTELERSYRAFAAGEDPDLPDRTADYLACCAERAAQEAGAAVDRYAAWIAGVPRLRLPLDLPRPARDATAGAEVRVELDRAETESVAAGARHHRTSRFPLLFAAFAAVLADWSGQDRFLVNAYVHGRRGPREERVMGRFANLVPFPVDATGRATPAALVEAVSRTWWDSFEHHAAPVPALVRRLEPDLPEGQRPFCDAAFQCNVGEPELAAGGEPRLRRVREPTTFSPNDLTLFAGPSLGGRFELRVEYRTDLYREDTAWRFLRDYQAVLAELSGPGHVPLVGAGRSG